MGLHFTVYSEGWFNHRPKIRDVPFPFNKPNATLILKRQKLFKNNNNKTLEKKPQINYIDQYFKIEEDKISTYLSIYLGP